MYKIRIPASTSNLGPGFDCLGLALGMYNTFSFEIAPETKLEGIEERYNNEDNLFLKAFRSTYTDLVPNLHVIFETDIPISRGLGSSATFTLAGILAGYILQGKPLIGEDILAKATAIEGHPDNVAPCLCGGLTACLMDDNGLPVMRSLLLPDCYHYTLLIPDFEVSTEEARAILPDVYLREVAVNNCAHAILLVEALRSGDFVLLKDAAHDQIHEPYRKTLIPEFDTLKQCVEEDTGGCLFISGSGSTCFLISHKDLSNKAIETIHSLPNHWEIQKIGVTINGAEILEDGIWHPII